MASIMEVSHKLRKLDPWSLNIVKYEKLMPPTSVRADEEFRRLRDDIDKNGQQHPVQIYLGGVIDGVQRVLVMRELGKRVIVEFLPEEMFPLEMRTAHLQLYIFNRQLSRRNLRDSGWNTCLAKAYEIEKVLTGKTIGSFAREKAAELGVTQSSIKNSVRAGKDAAKVPVEVQAKVYKTCDSPAAVVSKLSILPTEKQVEIVTQNDTQKAIESAVRKEVDERAKQLASERVDTPPECAKPTDHSDEPTCQCEQPEPSTRSVVKDSVILKVRELLGRSKSLLEGLVAMGEDCRDFSDTLKIVESAVVSLERAATGGAH